MNKTKRHFLVLGIIALVGIAASFVVWLHPTLGYGGPDDWLFANEDMRAVILALAWFSYLAFGVFSTLAAFVMPRRLAAALRYTAIYAVGLGGMVLANRVLDFYI